MISSLVGLKAGEFAESEVFDDLQMQIDTISLVHEKLYQSDNVMQIDPAVYLREILDAVFSFHPGVTVEMNNNVPGVQLGAKHLIPLGLICNEIALNAVKHGFDSGEAVFSIDFREVTYDNHYVIVFSNSGRPIPENVGLDNPDTLGLRLITLLTEQLKGTIDLQRSPRPEFTLSFPLD
jgi:two-component sensor histidine kinase